MLAPETAQMATVRAASTRRFHVGPFRHFDSLGSELLSSSSAASFGTFHG
jgi:hypothetical protein